MYYKTENVNCNVSNVLFKISSKSIISSLPDRVSLIKLELCIPGSRLIWNKIKSSFNKAVYLLKYLKWWYFKVSISVFYLDRIHLFCYIHIKLQYRNLSHRSFQYLKTIQILYCWSHFHYRFFSLSSLYLI